MNDTKHESKQNASHTPGPWAFEVSTNCDSVFSIADGVVQIAEVERWNGDNETDIMAEAEANARLIAASPRLLAALEQVVAWAEPESGNFSSEEIEWLAEAKAAIAEAKGLAA